MSQQPAKHRYQVACALNVSITEDIRKEDRFTISFDASAGCLCLRMPHGLPLWNASAGCLCLRMEIHRADAVAKSTGQRIACAAPRCACMTGSSLADCSQQDSATSRHSEPGTLPIYDMRRTARRGGTATDAGVFLTATRWPEPHGARQLLRQPRKAASRVGARSLLDGIREPPAQSRQINELKQLFGETHKSVDVMAWELRSS